MPRFSEYIDRWDALRLEERQEFGRKLNWLESNVAAWANQLNQAISSIVIPEEVPTGGKFIGIYKTSCPSGWTRATALDDKFLRGAATYGGTGGSDTHTHTYDTVIAHTHTGPSHRHSISASGTHTHPDHTRTTAAADLAAGAVGFATATDTTVTTGAGGAHSHGGYTGYAGAGSTGSTGSAEGTTAAGSTLPAYIEVVFCSKD